MIYSYQRLTRDISRPIIPFTVAYQDKLVNYRALVDSGADYCVFGLEVAKALGIKLSSKNQTSFRGLNDPGSKAYWAKININFPDSTYQTLVAFADTGKLSFGLLGQKGFFDHFDIKFSHKNQTVELTPI